MKLKYLVISACALLAADSFAGKTPREKRLAAQREKSAPYPQSHSRPDSGFSSTHGSKKPSPTDFSKSAGFFQSVSGGLEQEAAEGLIQLSKDPLVARRAYLQGIHDSYNAVLVVEEKELIAQFLSNTIQSLLELQGNIYDRGANLASNVRDMQAKGVKKMDLKLQSLLVQEHSVKEENDLVSSALGFYIHAYNERKFGRGSSGLVKLWAAQVVQNANSLKSAGLRKYPEFKSFGK